MTYEHAEHFRDESQEHILIQLGKSLEDPSFFEEAIQAFQEALLAHPKQDAAFYWNWGKAWVLLGRHSGEISDVSQGLIKLKLALQMGLRLPSFSIDFAEALISMAVLKGDPAYLEEALQLLRTSLASYAEREEVLAALWPIYANVMRLRFSLTHKKEHLEESDRTFCEAILTIPQNASLWLEWGELYLEAGWLFRDLSYIETALEKFTATKIRECDAAKTAALLGRALVIYGLYLDKLEPIKEGEARIRQALEHKPDHPELLFSLSFVELGLGLYFSEELHFANAADYLSSSLSEAKVNFQQVHTLFHVYLSWGLQKQELSLLQKGLQYSERLCRLCPYSSLYWNEWGVSLLRIRQIDSTREEEALILLAIEKFNRALELNDEGETLYNLGSAYDLLGELTGEEEDYAKSIELLVRALEERPKESHIRYRLGIALSHLGEIVRSAEPLMQAVEFLEEVVQEDPEDGALWCDLGYTLLLLSDILSDTLFPKEGERFRENAEKALIISAALGDEEASYHLACLYSLAGHYTSSMIYLKKAQLSGCLPAKIDLEYDVWLDGVRNTEEFQTFMMMQDDNDE